VGGACVTEELWPGYRVSTAASVSSLLRPEIVRDLELARHGFALLPRDPASFPPFPARRSPFLRPDRRPTRRELAKFPPRAPAAGDGVRPVSPRDGRVQRRTGRVGLRAGRHGRDQ